MADPENLVLSILREMRSEMSEFRQFVERRFDGVDRRFDGVEMRLDSVETKTDGLAILLASAFGHLSHEVSALNARVDALDSTRGLRPVYRRRHAVRRYVRRSSRRHAGPSWLARGQCAAGGPLVVFAPAGRHRSCSRLPTRRTWLASSPACRAKSLGSSSGSGQIFSSATAGSRAWSSGLGKGFGAIGVDGLRVTAGAGAPDVKVARAAAEAGIAGLTFLRGIPGAIGGALRMNGGAYGGETKDVFVSARGVCRDGRTVLLSPADMGFAYRKCAAPADIVFTEAVLAGTPGDPAAILREMQAITDARSTSQPVNTRTGGSTFKNPPGHSAWRLVDAAGCRGLRVGDAQVSPLHTNFLVNLGAATASDIETLGETVRARVPGERRGRARMGNPARRCAPLTRPEAAGR